jgi:hypothetical protein
MIARPKIQYGGKRRMLQTSTKPSSLDAIFAPEAKRTRLDECAVPIKIIKKASPTPPSTREVSVETHQELDSSPVRRISPRRRVIENAPVVVEEEESPRRIEVALVVENQPVLNNAVERFDSVLEKHLRVRSKPVLIKKPVKPLPSNPIEQQAPKSVKQSVKILPSKSTVIDQPAIPVKQPVIIHSKPTVEKPATVVKRPVRIPPKPPVVAEKPETFVQQAVKIPTKPTIVQNESVIIKQPAKTQLKSIPTIQPAAIVKPLVKYAPKSIPVKQVPIIKSLAKTPTILYSSPKQALDRLVTSPAKPDSYIQISQRIREQGLVNSASHCDVLQGGVNKRFGDEMEYIFDGLEERSSIAVKRSRYALTVMIP